MRTTQKIPKKNNLSNRNKKRKFRQISKDIEKIIKLPIVTFCNFLSNFKKHTAKNTTKPGNSP